MMPIMIGMKVDRPTHDAHGAALLAAGAKLFRARGLESVRVADVAAAAGLTHGAFYGHFASKSALAEASCRSGLAEGEQRWRRRVARAQADGRDPVAALIDAYLTERHRDAPAEGCVIGALGPDVFRADAALRAALAEGTASLLAILAAEILAAHPKATPEQARKAALATFAAMLGGLELARALAPDADASSRALTAAARLARQAAQPLSDEAPHAG